MMSKLWSVVDKMFRSRDARSALVTVVGTIAAAAVASFMFKAAVPPEFASAPVMQWAVRLATALTAGLAAFGILGRLWTNADGANRMLVTLTRAWLTTFVVIILTVDGEAALKTGESIRQQRLCANAAYVLKARGVELVQLGLRCSSPE